MPPSERAEPGDPTVVAGYRALNAFFDRIVVITLRRATARHAQLARSLDGLRYELFYGTDRQHLDLQDLSARGVYDPARARRLHRYGKTMTDGQVACALSHLDVWRQVIDGPHRRVLVMEDDAVPARGGLAQVGAALAELPPSWELLYLGYDRNEEVTARRRLDRLAYRVLGGMGLFYLSAAEASRLLPRPFSRRLRRAGSHDQTHAYAITPRAAEKLLQFQQPIALNVDTGITRVILQGGLEAYLTEPKVFYQGGLDSFIETSGSDVDSVGVGRGAPERAMG